MRSEASESLKLMSININIDKNIPIDRDACYEQLASQEVSRRRRKKWLRF